ncbi:SGNH hydrolase [Decorospora gaudefroyi]|uniref:SGNH hydrolase n=1 Tax=Decorospora gaudefroyi TaxID=184978 RepID=A0A6A5KEX5_9PLEO|nr:SGNH hydrolase [Decorospora gaudefroyi]
MMPYIGGRRVRDVLKLMGVVGVVLCFTLSLIWGLKPRKAPRPRPNLSLPLRILPLGDAITWGWQPANLENGTNGYRAPLLHELVYAHYRSVNLVGTQHSGLMPNNDNEGHPGFTLSQIMGAMKAGLEMRPNVVLLHAGTTDLSRPETAEERWRDAPKRLGSLLDHVLETCPDAVILVAKIIQAQKTQTRANVNIFNNAIPRLVEERVEKGFKLVVVDQSVVGPEELVDGLHPSYAGYFHMGNIWFQAVKDVSAKALITPPVAVQP